MHVRDILYILRKSLYIICYSFLLITCNKGNLDQSDFDFTVSVNKTEYQLGETIEYQIDGGKKKLPSILF